MDADLRANIATVVEIYAENRSFNNHFADFPGLQQPLSAVPHMGRNASMQRNKEQAAVRALWDVPA